MLVTRYEPFNDIRKSFDLVNQIINSVEQKREGKSAVTFDFVPKVNTREGKEAYHIEVELPGIKKEEVDIKIDGNVLTISGERNLRQEVNEEDYQKVESHYGIFSRSFTLPEEIDVENIHAESDNGIIEIVIPKLKKVDAKSKKIEIK